MSWDERREGCGFTQEGNDSEALCLGCWHRNKLQSPPALNAGPSGWKMSLQSFQLRIAHWASLSHPVYPFLGSIPEILFLSPQHVGTNKEMHVQKLGHISESQLVSSLWLCSWGIEWLQLTLQCVLVPGFLGDSSICGLFFHLNFKFQVFKEEFIVLLQVSLSESSHILPLAARCSWSYTHTQNHPSVG